VIKLFSCFLRMFIYWSAFNDSSVGVMEWRLVCNCNFRWMHNETFNTQTQNLVVHTKVTRWISFSVR